MFGMVTAIVVNEDPDFDPSLEPVEPSNWRNTAGTPIDRTQLDAVDGETHSNGPADDGAGAGDTEAST